jgi:hypothetical protein
VLKLFEETDLYCANYLNRIPLELLRGRLSQEALTELW